MRRTLLALLCALSFVPWAAAQEIKFGLGAGGSGTTTIASGTTPITGGADTQLCFNDGAFISCGDAGLVYAKATDILTMLGGATIGSVTTAGRATLNLRDTITGSSATSNFLNITGAFPATLSATTAGAVLSFTGDNDDRLQVGLDVSLSGALTVANSNNYALRSTFTGTTNNGYNVSMYGSNTGISNSAAYGIGTIGEVFINTASKNSVGLWGGASSANASSGKNVGVYGVVGSNGATPTYNYGVMGVAGQATNRFGGYFVFDTATYSSPLGTMPLAHTGTAALVADNGAVAANIFEARDNGTAVLTVADGGAISAVSSLTFTGTGGIQFPTVSGIGIEWSGSNNRIGASTANTPDSVQFLANTVSNSYHLNEYGDFAFDFNNGRCGTSACTNPALIVHSSDQSTTEYAQISTDTSGAAGFQSNFAEIRVGGTKTAITEGSAQAIVRFGIPTSTNVFGATVYYTVYDINGANYTSRAGQVRVQGGNSGGTATCTINAGQDTEAEDGSQIATSNAATLTYTWTNVVSTTNCDLSLNATSSQGTNTYGITWTAVVTGNSSSITVVGQ